MTRRKSPVRTAAPKSPRKPRRTRCVWTIAEDPPATEAASPEPLPPAKPPGPQRRHFRIPHRCTMGFQYYDERHDEQVVSRPVPKLRLSGRWLEQCGFAVGDDLQVSVGRGVLLVSRRTRG